MRTILFAIILLWPLARAIGQTDSLSECDSTFKAWKAYIETPRDYVGDVWPIPVFMPEPVYPDSARMAGKEGTVWVFCLVDTTGVPQCVRVYKGLGNELDEAAVAVVKNWRFTPLGQPGRRKKVPDAIPIKFKLKMNNEK